MFCCATARAAAAAIVLQDNPIDLLSDEDAPHEQQAQQAQQQQTQQQAQGATRSTRRTNAFRTTSQRFEVW